MGYGIGMWTSGRNFFWNVKRQSNKKKKGHVNEKYQFTVSPHITTNLYESNITFCPNKLQISVQTNCMRKELWIKFSMLIISNMTTPWQ